MNKVIAEPAKPTIGCQWQVHMSLQFASSAFANQIGPCGAQAPCGCNDPESNCCHIYVLYPPGRIAAGDSLQLDVSLQTRSELLLITSSAGNVYTTDAAPPSAPGAA